MKSFKLDTRIAKALLDTPSVSFGPISSTTALTALYVGLQLPINEANMRAVDVQNEWTETASPIAKAAFKAIKETDGIFFGNELALELARKTYTLRHDNVNQATIKLMLNGFKPSAKHLVMGDGGYEIDPDGALSYVTVDQLSSLYTTLTDIMIDYYLANRVLGSAVVKHSYPLAKRYADAIHGKYPREVQKQLIKEARRLLDGMARVYKWQANGRSQLEFDDSYMVESFIEEVLGMPNNYTDAANFIIRNSKIMNEEALEITAPSVLDVLRAR